MNAGPDSNGQLKPDPCSDLLKGLRPVIKPVILSKMVIYFEWNLEAETLFAPLKYSA